MRVWCHQVAYIPHRSLPIAHDHQLVLWLRLVQPSHGLGLRMRLATLALSSVAFSSPRMWPPLHFCCWGERFLPFFSDVDKAIFYDLKFSLLCQSHLFSSWLATSTPTSPTLWLTGCSDTVPLPPFQEVTVTRSCNRQL